VPFPAGRAWKDRWRGLRDGSLFVGGLLITIHETFVVAGERKVLLALAAAMMGLAGAFRLDLLRRNGPPGVGG
jgi:hypothetical protein